MEKMKENHQEITKGANQLTIPAITGELILSQDKKRIEVNLQLKVSDSNFAYTGSNYVIEDETGLKGIVFSYYNTADSRVCDTDEIDDNSPTIPITGMIQKSAFVNWNENDDIRVMVLNEEDEDEFIAMKTCFKKYLKEFQTRRDVNALDVDSFIAKWNNDNKDYQLNVGCDDKQPRYTKDGGVLTLKFRR